MKIFHFAILTVFLFSCQSKEIDLSRYNVSDPNLHIHVVAAEPDVIAPVAIDFDKRGRLWVAEMPDYMPDINGEFEHIPSGRILILEDTNGDGRMDHRKVFKDSIHQLRAIRLFNDGILFADDPNLYYAQIKEDRPYQITVIDSMYASGGNVEHKPNGLVKNVDNCFYSAKSQFRYCYDDDEWTKEAVFFRGQWGITQDENGRIYTNDNSNFLFGDAFLPATLTHNKYITKKEGINDDLVGDRTVFPLHPTSVNRGYSEGTLDEDGKLTRTTSACGPYIHQTGDLGEQYRGDAFVCVPEANLIKRLKLNGNGFQQKATFVSEENEFIASTDEAFRPVNISVGPDDHMYIVDFHRGIIQHKIYMTNYLKEQIEEKKLDQITNMGRILRIQQKGAISKPKYDFGSVDSLIYYLGFENPWLRRMAQEALIFSSEPSVEEKLYQALLEESKLKRIHTLWTLHARGKIDLKKIAEIKFRDPWVIAHLFKILTQLSASGYDADFPTFFESYKEHESEVVQNHLTASLHIIYEQDPGLHRKIWLGNSDVLEVARLSAFPSGVEVNYAGNFETYNQKISEDEKYYIHLERSGDLSEEGYDLYNTYCSSCHGHGGNGVEGQAPSLVGSKIVNSSVEAVPLVIMHGIEGEITVDGNKERYASVMPAMAKSADLTTEDIVKISNYVYNAFRENVQYISQAGVDSLQMVYSNKKDLWNEEELLGTE